MRVPGPAFALAGGMRKVLAAALLVATVGCHRKPIESTAGSTDTVQPTTTGTTATETGGGTPVTTTSTATSTMATTGTGNASGSGSNGTSGTLPGGTAPTTSTH